jgi:hypothetical protein
MRRGPGLRPFTLSQSLDDDGRADEGQKHNECATFHVETISEEGVTTLGSRQMVCNRRLFFPNGPIRVSTQARCRQPSVRISERDRDNQSKTPLGDTMRVRFLH